MLSRGRGVSGQRGVTAAGAFAGARSYGGEWSNEVLCVRVVVNSVSFYLSQHCSTS